MTITSDYPQSTSGANTPSTASLCLHLNLLHSKIKTNPNRNTNTITNTNANTNTTISQLERQIQIPWQFNALSWSQEGKD